MRNRFPVSFAELGSGRHEFLPFPQLLWHIASLAQRMRQKMDLAIPAQLSPRTTEPTIGGVLGQKWVRPEVRMIEWLTETASSWELNWAKAFMGLGVFIISFIGSIALVSFLLVKLPSDYFAASLPRDAQKQQPVRSWIVVIGKNILGLMLVILGVVLSLPGFPGQGIITILIGLVLIDFPGKARLLRWVLSHPKALASVNRLRQRYGKTPLSVG
jgi:hypothetical protein